MKIVYYSASGNTEKMANLIAEGIAKAGKSAEVINVSNANANIFDDEELVKDKKFIYQIIKFKKGKRHYSKKEYFFGPVLIKKKGTLFEEYYKREKLYREILISILPKNYRYKKFITRREIKMIDEEI